MVPHKRNCLFPQLDSIDFGDFYYYFEPHQATGLIECLPQHLQNRHFFLLLDSIPIFLFRFYSENSQILKILIQTIVLKFSF